MSDDDMMELPVIRWHKGLTFPMPEGYEPSYVDLGVGETVDERRWLLILDALLTTHPEAERVRAVTTERPGLSANVVEGDPMIRVSLATGEPLGMFDKRLLDVNLTPWVEREDGSPG